jgi:hypothetical protein
MKQRVLGLIVFTIAVLLTGCAQPCFYQAGKSVAECRSDLLECLHSVDPVVCMQNRGYECLDARKLPQDTERIELVAPFGEYWAVGGFGVAPDHQRISSEPELQMDDPKEESPGRIVEYRVERGDLGTLKVTLVYEVDEPQ